MSKLSTAASSSAAARAALCAAPLLALALTACSGTIGEDGVNLSSEKRPAQAERETAAVVATRQGAQPSPEAAPARPQAAAASGAKPPPVRSRPNPSRRIPNPPFVSTPKATFDQPWAMAFLPDGRVLVTEKPGNLKLYNPTTNTTGTITGVPSVQFGGQGGLGDVALHPQFASNRYVYFSYAEAGANSTRGAVIARAALTLDNNGGGSLGTSQVVWRQSPKVSGEGHYSHRMLFDSSGKLWVTSGDRQKLDPAQDMNSALGKVLRLNDDGTVPSDNPFASQGGVTAQVWSFGHRNPLGIARDGAGRIWTNEMGPLHGDELNLIERGANYGWPRVSNGSHYDGVDIPDHAANDGYNAPEAWWNPSICPSSMMIYSGDLFPYFKGHGFIGGLCSQAIVRIQFDGTTAREAERYAMGRRIREIEQGPDGAIWVLEDGSSGRLLRLTPVPF
jgi:glucose/arabinose dehydrogenase